MKIVRGMLSRLAIAGAAAAVSVGIVQAQDANAVSFEGKTVDIMVNYEAGGAVDTAARMLAPHIVKYLPGNPNVIVTNKNGAGGTAAVDYLIDSVPPDGMHIGYFSGTLPRWAMALQQVPEGTGDLPYVAARSVNQIIQARADTGVTYDTLPGWEEPLFMSMNSPDNHVSIRMRMLANVLGVKDFQIVTGYTSMAKMVGALRAGEADITQTNDAYYGPNKEALLGDGVISTIGQMGEYQDGKIVAQTGLEDVKVLDQLWREQAPETLDSAQYKAWEAMHIAVAVQHVFVMPPNTAPEYVAVWSDAILKAYNDPDYVKQATEMGSPIPSYVGAEGIGKYMARMKELFADPEVKDAIKDAIRQNVQ